MDGKHTPISTPSNMYALGTTNKGKVGAFNRALAASPSSSCEVLTFECESGVPNQPLGWEQTEQGARTRAISVYIQARQQRPTGRIIGIGLESGIMRGQDGVMVDQTVLAVYDGTYTSISVSAPTPVPRLDLLAQSERDQSVTFGKLYAPQGVALDGSPLTHDDWHRYIGPSRYQLLEELVAQALTF